MLQMLNACRRCQVEEENCLHLVMNVLRRVVGIEEEDSNSFVNKCLAIEKAAGKVCV